MSKSTTTFDRWKPLERATWSFQVFSKYNDELMKLWGSHLSSRAFTYSQLKKVGAEWTDSPSLHFDVSIHPASFCHDMKSWSDAYNTFENWVNLSVVLTIASNLETYIASVVRLALESDPGLLLGTPHAIDGAYVMKHRKLGALDLRTYIEGCTKGSWSSRLATLQRVFGACPTVLQNMCSDLEKLRIVRNDFAHAFGRNIDEARRTGTLAILPMEKMTRKKTERLRMLVLQGARSLDKVLLSSHIGEFEAVSFYQQLHSTLNQQVNQGQRAANFKKAIGHHGAGLRGKVYCNGLVKYWEAL